uniref:Uncharacterized protein n=1 Tax=Arion vulgaris TaxID=1028688 RepID=A0A0B6ZI50_9EUPU
MDFLCMLLDLSNPGLTQNRLNCPDKVQVYQNCDRLPYQVYTVTANTCDLEEGSAPGQDL